MAAHILPRAVRSIIRAKVSLVDYDLQRRVNENPYYMKNEKDYQESEFCLGIIEDLMQYHKYYISACRDLGVSYRVLSILDDDWVERFRLSGCDAFLAWPTVSPTNAKSAFDYRLFMLEREMEQVVFPSWKECWLTENKLRLRDWLQVNNIPHPKTSVFYSKKEALDFAAQSEYPVVVKTATGASGSGVVIANNEKQLVKCIRKSFGKGLRPKSFDSNDRQWGYVFIQKYYPNVQEWRMIRIGSSYFGYRKEPDESGIHSASKKWSWLEPDSVLLELLKDVSDLGEFESMDVDLFLTEDGEIFVNECQTVFGCTTPAIQMKVNGEEGRYVNIDGDWKFESGEFSTNHMCNLRIKHLLSKLKENN